MPQSLLILGFLLTISGPSFAFPPGDKVAETVRIQAPDCLIAIQGLSRGTYFEVWGDPSAPAVVLFHGLYDTHATFDGLARELAKDFRVVTFDVRGVGFSRANGFDYSTKALAGDVIAIMDQLGIRQAHLLGHSLGARTAVRLAELFPGRVLSVIVEDIDLTQRARADRQKSEERARALSAVCPRSYRSRAIMESRLRAVMGSEGTFLSTFYREDKLTGQCTLDFEPYAVFLWDAVCNSENLISAAAKVSVPLLYLRGGDSKGTTAAGVASLLAARPGTTVVTIKGAGHYLHEDKPALFLDEVQNFLKPKPPRD